LKHYKKKKKVTWCLSLGKNVERISTFLSVQKLCFW